MGMIVPCGPDLLEYQIEADWHDGRELRMTIPP